MPDSDDDLIAKAMFPDGLTAPDVDDDEFERELMAAMLKPVTKPGLADPDCGCFCHDGGWIAHHFGGPCCSNPHGRRA